MNSNLPSKQRFPASQEMLDLVRLYLDEMPARVSFLQEAHRAADRQLVKRLAHQLKGSAGSYGFPVISKRAGVLEDVMAGDARPDDINRLITEIVELCSEARLQCSDGPLE